MIKFSGNLGGWRTTGIKVRKGEWIRVKASGWIGFAHGGWHRDPNGRDSNGHFESPAKSYGNNHPAGNCIKNSLILKINNYILQGGTNKLFKSPDTGEIFISNNDNYCTDNSGAWNVHISAGNIRQKLLFIVNGYDRNMVGTIEGDIRKFEQFVQNATNNEITIEHKLIALPNIDSSELVNYGEKWGFIAGYSWKLDQELRKQGINPFDYAGIFRIYNHPYSSHNSAFGGNTWIWFNDRLGRKDRPGYTSIIGQQMYQGQEPPADYILHEYLHQLDHRFNDAKITEFADADHRGKNGIPAGATKQEYYRNILQITETGRRPPYGILHDIMGHLV